MYLSASQVLQSIAALSSVHPFHGITFLACKEAGLPVGKTIDFSLDARTHEFLEHHHKLDPHSQFYFQPFRSSDSTKKWVRHNYSSTGLQAINTQTFGDAFIHPRNTRSWGWSPKYLEVLVDRLPQDKKIPAYELAVWLFRDTDLPASTTPTMLVERFVQKFRLGSAELTELFDVRISTRLKNREILGEVPSTWAELRGNIPAAPDAKPDQGGVLTSLSIVDVGPADVLAIEPAPRLTLIAGDNGLGKTFLLECAWWALTGTWAGRPAYPTGRKKRGKPQISFEIKGEQFGADRVSILYDWKTSTWPQPRKRPTMPGLIVYARVDGSFAVWDPARQSSLDPLQSKPLVFDRTEVWDGLPGRIEGLVRDWIRWQNNPTKFPYTTFVEVLGQLSPPDLGQLKPGPPERIPDDPRDIPTIEHTFGAVPIVFASAGVRRIITLAYLIVWAWSEHLIAAELSGSVPQRRMVILVDELEAHLHPRWQRSVLPALLSVGGKLSPELQPQYICATHSPLAMASAEPIFNVDTDALFHLDVSRDGLVSLEEIDFVKFGDVSSWLTSPVFELRHARSNEAELAIEDAKRLQLQEKPVAADIQEVSNRLVNALAADDRFWPRWLAFAERFGVKL